jgi:hypothetical protein
MWIAGGNDGAGTLLFGEVCGGAEFVILVLGKEFVMVDVCDWCLRRGKVSLLGEEAWLSGCVNRGRGSSWTIRPTAGGSTGRGREREVDGVGKKSVESFCQRSSYIGISYVWCDPSWSGVGASS